MLLVEGWLSVSEPRALARVQDWQNDRDHSIAEGQRLDILVGKDLWAKGYYVPFVQHECSATPIPWGLYHDFSKPFSIHHRWYSWDFSLDVSGAFVGLVDVQYVRLYAEYHDYAQNQCHHR